MITKRQYVIYKPINISLIGGKYWYDELTINVKEILLFNIIPIYKKKTFSALNTKKCYVKPKIKKMV